MCLRQLGAFEVHASVGVGYGGDAGGDAPVNVRVVMEGSKCEGTGFFTTMLAGMSIGESIGASYILHPTSYILPCWQA